MSDQFHPYADQHKKPQGAGDSRPTAYQIIKDEGREGTMTDKTILITGATSGIGVETARALHATGARIFITARDMKKAEDTIKDIKSTSKGSGEIVPIEMDLGSLASVKKGAEDFLKKSDQLNILVNNAGIMACPEGRTVDGYELQFGTNHLSHFLLFTMVKDLLLKSSTPEFNSRVVNLSSVGHRTNGVFLDNYNLEGIYAPWVSYGQAKTANIYMANEIDRLYGSQGLHALSLHPGGIWTPLQKFIPKEQLDGWAQNPEMQNYMKSTEQGAATTVWAAVGKVWEGQGGKYLQDCGVAPPAPKTEGFAGDGYAPYAYDEEKEKKLWDLSLELVKVV